MGFDLYLPFRLIKQQEEQEKLLTVTLQRNSENEIEQEILHREL